jgi:hypothetical protein
MEMSLSHLFQSMYANLRISQPIPANGQKLA